jgi:hypothetical protein
MLMLRTSPECRDEDTTVLNNLLFWNVRATFFLKGFLLCFGCQLGRSSPYILWRVRS